MFTSIHRSTLFSIVLLSAGCTGSKESPVAEHRQASTDPAPVVVHSEFGVDPSTPALAGEEPDVAYNIGLPQFDGEKFSPPINGGVHLVVWSDGADVYGERVSDDGAPLEPGQFVISASPGSQTHPRVAPIDFDQYAVVFEDDRNGHGVYATHVDFDGNVAGEILIAEGSGPYFFPAVSCSGSLDPTGGGWACLAVWWDGSEIMGEPFAWDYNNKVFSTHAPMRISSAGAHGSGVVSAPAIAANRSTFDGYAVAWNESPIGGSSVDLRAVRLSIPAFGTLPDGGSVPVILQEPEITVAQDTAALSGPSIASGYLMSWVRRIGTSTGAITAVRVGYDGSVLDSPPLTLGSVATTHGGSAPSSMSSGVVVWDDDQSALYGARVTESGQVVTLGRIASAPPGGSLAHARGAVLTLYDPLGYGGRGQDIVVWTQNAGATDPSDRLHAAMQNFDGAPFGAPFELTGAGSPASAVVAGNASEFLVLWAGNGIRLDRNGKALDSHPFAAPTGAVASDGTDFAVVWSASGDIHGSKILRNGTVGADTTIIAGPNPEGAPAIASNGSNYVIVWLEQDPANEGTTILHEGVLDLDLHVQQTITLASDQSNFILSPAVASDGDGYMAVWSEVSICSSPGCSVGAFQIYGIAFQADGSLSPDYGFWIAVGEAGLDEFSPSIASAGGPGAGYVVAYTERSGNSKGEIRALRALHVWPPVMGAPAPEVLTIGNANLYEGSPSVGRICDENLVAWTRGDYTVLDHPPGPRDLIGATIANGTATELPISNTTNDESAPATFGLGPSALVVYSTFAGVRARLVTAGCGGTASDGGGGGGASGAGGGVTGAGGMDGGAGAPTGTGGLSGLPDASSSGGATDGGAAGGASGSGGQAGSPDASGSGGATGSGGANASDAGLDASGSGGTGGNGSGGESSGGSGGENGSGGQAGSTGGKGGHGGRGGPPASGGRDAGTSFDGGLGHGHGRGRDWGCGTTTQPRTSTTDASALALIALSVVRRRSARRRIHAAKQGLR